MSDFIAAPLVASGTASDAWGMPDPPRLRVLILAADAADRRALRERLQRDGMAVCGEADEADGASAIAVVEHPDVVLVADRPPLDGVAAVEALGAAYPAARVMLIGADAADSTMLAAVRAGAAGYVRGDPTSPGLTSALLDAAAGRSAFPRSVEALLIAGLRDACN
jgi:DNA-binding NarL/FixJ family response regulator